MATNLRLSEEMAAALRDRAESTGRSQQDLLREAVARYLGLHESSNDREQALAVGAVAMPTPYRRVTATIKLPAGLSSLDLLDRDDR